MSEMRSPDEARLQPPGVPEIELAAQTHTLVVGPYLTRNAAAQASGAAEAQNLRSVEARLDEATGLAAAIELDVIGSLAISLPRIRPSSYLGKGRVEEIAGLIRPLPTLLGPSECPLRGRLAEG